jgi:hypothetical protein
MVDTYTIYIVNQSASAQQFWCFLTPPVALVNNPGVYANSSASLEVAPNYGGTNQFVIPVQYVVGAGASNQAVGLNVQVISNFTQDTNLGQGWLASYVNAPPNEGPTIAAAAATTPQQIAITTNAFNQVSNDDAHWYANQSFGILTEAGFVGMTWSPSPSGVQTLYRIGIGRGAERFRRRGQRYSDPESGRNLERRSWASGATQPGHQSSLVQVARAQ